MDAKRHDGPGGDAERDMVSIVLVEAQFFIQYSNKAAPGDRGRREFFSESLILAQNERWQRGLGMQVERDPGV